MKEWEKKWLLTLKLLLWLIFWSNLLSLTRENTMFPFKSNVSILKFDFFSSFLFFPFLFFFLFPFPFFYFPSSSFCSPLLEESVSKKTGKKWWKSRWKLAMLLTMLIWANSKNLWSSTLSFFSSLPSLLLTTLSKPPLPSFLFRHPFPFKEMKTLTKKKSKPWWSS